MKSQRNASLSINTNFSSGDKPVWIRDDLQLRGAPPSGRKAEHKCISWAEYQENENENCPSWSLLISQWELEPTVTPSLGFMLQREVKEVLVTHPCPLPCQGRAPIICQNIFKVLKIAATANWWKPRKFPAQSKLSSAVEAAATRYALSCGVIKNVYETSLVKFRLQVLCLG